MNTPAKRNAIPSTFDGLLAIYNLRPIRSRKDLHSAREICDRLAVLDRRSAAQDDYLETLSLLIEKYELSTTQIDASNVEPIEILRELLSANEMNASDLGRLLGNRALGGAILRGDRQLSKTHIAILCRRFAVSADLFLPVQRTPMRRTA